MRFGLHLLAALLLIEEDAGCHEDGTADDERLADESRAVTGLGEGWSKLMEDLTDLRIVLPEASGTAGFFWNGLSFDCFSIVCSQTGRLKRRPNRQSTNK